MKEFKFFSIYELVSLIDWYVDSGEEFYNFNEEMFIESATKFSKDTLLHLYIVTRAINHYSRDFRKNGDLFEKESYDEWQEKFCAYGLIIPDFDFTFPLKEEPYDWFHKNIEKFEELFDAMAKEAVHILFYNRNFLFKFNKVVAEGIESIEIPKIFLTKKGTIKRQHIPKWVKTAVFHRDKGRCVYCNANLTGIDEYLTKENFDHMVPLDLNGANDPCNIQLTCENCNKKKSNRGVPTSYNYMPWW